MRETKTIDVVCALIEDGAGRILATRRPPGKAYGGLWEFPGGKVEPGETPADALRREIREELDLEIEVGADEDAVEHHDDTGVCIRLRPFRATVRGGRLRLHEHTEFRWVLPVELDTLEWAPADRPIVARLAAGVSFRRRREATTEPPASGGAAGCGRG
ncbi:MAG: (deoxy)nucleoside triphosphate pyrophosphohydrolase [Puniceicoccaceae bacterium]|nr:MAG: (deoxy)nucleoside triphosphate pyrophosphohydrolase [Puniceicoccaceae bacterium]